MILCFVLELPEPRLLPLQAFEETRPRLQCSFHFVPTAHELWRSSLRKAHAELAMRTFLLILNAKVLRFYLKILKYLNDMQIWDSE